MEEANGAPAPVTNGSTPPSSPAAPPKEDFESRMRSDPAFALDQYNKMKSENTKLFQKQKSAEALFSVADQLGGAGQAAQFIYEYDALLKHPEVKRAADHYRKTGTLPTASEKRPESNEFDELFPDPAQQKLQELQGQVAALQQQISQTRGSVGKQAVMGMLTQLKAENPDGFDEFILPELNEQFSQWERTPQGREILATLNYDGLTTIAGRAVMRNRDAIYERTHARKLEELKRGATGAPAGNLSTGREPRPPATNKRMTASEALAEFERREGPLMRR